MTKVQLIDIHAVAALFKVSTRTIRHWWYEGKIPAPLKINRTIRWDAAKIESFIVDCHDTAEADRPSDFSITEEETVK